LDWIGLGQQKMTHVQLWYEYAALSVRVDSNVCSLSR